jgi:ABC-type transporter Mla MlaB component
MDGVEVRALCERLGSLLDAGRSDRVECECSALTDGDLRTVDALARLQLTARRRGANLLLHGAPDGLAELVSLVGLARILRLGVQVIGQAEHREEAGRVQEEGDPGDPVT